MKTMNLKRTGFGGIAGIIGCMAAFAFMACNSSSPTAGGEGSNSAVVGRMGDNSTAKRAATVQGVVVTAFTINADGSRGSEVGRDTTDAQGYFQIQSALRGSQNWLIVATQGNMEWMTRYNDTLTDADEDTTRPINFESTLQTQVYLSLQSSSQGRQVSSGEITAAIDLNVAASSRSQYENGDSASRVSMISNFKAEIIAQSQARASYLSHDNSQYASDTGSASASVRRAEANLTLALYAANSDSAQTRQAEKIFLQAMISAYANGSDSSANSYSRANEASYQATLLATATVGDSSRSAMRRRSLHIMAVAADTAMQREYSRANASSVQLQAVAAASATFENSADTTRSDASRDSIASHYRASLRTVFQSQSAGSDSSFISFLTISTTGILGTSLQTLSHNLQVKLAADNDASQIGQDMQSSNALATAAIQGGWQTNSHNTGNADRNSAMAQIMAFLSVSSNSSHNGA